MPEWTGKQNAGALNISPPDSPDSSTSSIAPQARTPSRASLPPLAETSRPLPPPPPPPQRTASTASTASMEQPPKPPSTTAPTPPRPSHGAATPQEMGIPQPTMVRPPSYEDVTRAAEASPTGPPPPAESVPPRVDTIQPMPRVVSMSPSTPGRVKASRASAMRPQGKGTPARRGKTKQSSTPPVPAMPSTTRMSGAGGGGNVGRNQAEEAPAAMRSSPLAVEVETEPEAAPAPAAKPQPSAAEPPWSPARPTTGALARRMLDIEVIEAAGLLGTEKGGVSNPRAEVLLVDLGGRAIASEGVKRTRVIRGTTNPVWNDKMSFGEKANLSAPIGGNMPTLRVQVVSEQRFGADKPLGMVDISLMNLSPDGEESQQFYSLEPFGRLRAGGRLGSIHLRIRIGAVADKRDTSSRIILNLQQAREGRGDEEPGYMEYPPNFLRVKLHQAQDLMAMDSGNTSDPFVIFRLGEKEQRSSVIYKTLNPRWDEVFEFECTSSGEALEITVEDEDRVYNDFLGFVSILMGDLEDKRKMTQLLYLKLKSGELPPGEDRGAIEITTQWFYNPNIASTEKPEKSVFVPKLVKGDDWDKEDPNAQIAAEEADPEEKKKEEEEKKKLIEELRDFKGTSDPVVYVEAFGQKFATEVVKDRLNAVFDETFVINLRNMDQDDFKEGVFRVSVMDADVTIGNLGSLKADLIGAVSFDATYVYQSKDHEVHRRWVALVDDQNPDDTGIQGYLHLSIAIVGPGDKLKVHDEEADRRRERAAEANVAGGMDSLVVMPPTIEVQQKWLVTTVVKAEYLPVMDKTFAGGAGGGDFFFQVEVAGGKPLRTKKVTLSGERHRLNPEWRNELWQPVTMPCMSGNVKFSIWDWDAVGNNDLVAVFYGKLGHIEKRTKVATRWVNLYGPPLNIPETRNLKELTKRAATLGLTSQTDYLNQYLNFPQHASTYRGRVLVAERIVDEAPKPHDKDKVAWRWKVKAPPVPKAAAYAIRLFVGSGTEIPQFTDVAHFGKNKKMWIRISVGRYELQTEPVDNNNGVCDWYQPLQLKSNFNLPADPDDVPDVVIYLMAGTGTSAQPCSFRRFPAKELMDENFGGTPKWVRLKEDKVLDLLVENEFPGSVLVRMGFGPLESYVTNREKWTDDIQGLLKREPYELRVHLYQARNLPAADSSGLIDPYLKVKFKGETVNTEKIKDLRRRQTVDPIWYHTVRFKTSLPPKRYQQYFPQVTIQLFDYDHLVADDYAGNLFLDLQGLEIISADRRTEKLPAPPTPQWKSFFMEAPGDGQGELLVSMQLIHTNSADMPEPQSIVPQTRQAHLDMVIMGIRNMQPYKYLPMQLPYCVFEVDDMDGTKRTVLTDTSNKPTGRDANFLQRIKMEVRLPLDVIYAPRVKIRVYDTRLGGFNVPLVGSGRIELGKKLPWSPEYEAPLAKTFAREALLRAITADGQDSTLGENYEFDDDEEGKRDASVNGSVTSDRAGDSKQGSTRGRSSRPGSAKSSRSGGGGGVHFGSDYGSVDDDFDGDFGSEFGGDPAGGGMVPGGVSGFGGGAFGGAGGASTRRAHGGGGRTSRRVFEAPRSARSGRSRTRTDFGGVGGGALDLVRQDSVDNTPELDANGQVIDTGIGVMPALDLARQKAGILATSAASTPMAEAGGAGGVGGAAGVLGDTGAGIGVGVLAGGSGGLDVPADYAVEGWEEDDELSGVPKYLKGRQELDRSLEEELAATPFESYDLFRGQLLGNLGGGSTLKKVGTLKCIVRVTKGNPDDDPLFVDKRNFPTLAKAKARNDIIMAELLKPRAYKVRLYVLQALNLTPMDIGIGGRPGKSDPYLRVRLGKESFNDKKNYIDDVTDADFYKCVELNSTLPGASQLQIDVVDYDDIGRDELIGRTTIDLEDRWFDTRWQAWGLQNRSEELNNMRFQTKPVETRTLKVPTSLAPQGQLRCWLDIMSTEDARAFPPDDVSLPPNLDFEVRVVFWKCKDVVSMDTVTEQNDLFVRSWVEGCDSQETDTHWFAKKGKGSFNWRMKFKVSLGPRTRAWKFPYLTVQLWDRDLFKFNDHIAEGQLDLGPYFMKAYKTRDTVKLFPKIDPKLIEMRKADAANMDVDAAMGDNDATERLVAAESGPAAYDPERYPRPSLPPYGNGGSTTDVGSSAVVGDQGSRVPQQEVVNGSGPALAATTSTDVAPRTKKKKRKKKGCCAWICPCCCGGGGIKTADAEPGDPSDEDEDAEAAADARAFINQIKNITGLWDNDPDESYWLNMERTNYATGQKEQMGKCLMGVQIWPIDKANLQPVGNGRSEPNSQPFLPPPAGRLRFSLNPFVMGSELFGPKICAKICCACCCIITILLLVYFSGFFNLLFSLAVTLFTS